MRDQPHDIFATRLQLLKDAEGPRSGRGPGDPRVVGVVPLQPRPILTLSVQSLGGGSTAIYRKFAPGESARCRLCPGGHCAAVDDGCLLMVRGAVGPDEAPLFDANALRWPKGGAR